MPECPSAEGTAVLMFTSTWPYASFHTLRISSCWCLKKLALSSSFWRSRDPNFSGGPFPLSNCTLAFQFKDPWTVKKSSLCFSTRNSFLRSLSKPSGLERWGKFPPPLSSPSLNNSIAQLARTITDFNFPFGFVLKHQALSLARFQIQKKKLYTPLEHKTRMVNFVFWPSPILLL